MVTEEDIKNLIGFVSSVKEDIRLAVSQILEIDPDLQPLHELIQGAWKDVEPRFQETIEALGERDALERWRKQFDERGLWGDQLRLKLSLYDLRSAQFRGALEDFLKLPGEEKKTKRGFLGGIFGRLCDIIDAILRSLGFLPGPDAVEEFKAVLKQFI